MRTSAAAERVLQYAILHLELEAFPDDRLMESALGLLKCTYVFGRGINKGKTCGEVNKGPFVYVGADGRCFLHPLVGAERDAFEASQQRLQEEKQTESNRRKAFIAEQTGRLV